MLGKATLEDLASEGTCKLVMSHPHMQQHFDEVKIIILYRVF